MPARYAVYYAPSAGDALHQAVTPLLGRDALGGLNVPQATPPGVNPVFWKAITRVPASSSSASSRSATCWERANRSSCDRRARAAISSERSSRLRALVSEVMGCGTVP